MLMPSCGFLIRTAVKSRPVETLPGVWAGFFCRKARTEQVVVDTLGGRLTCRGAGEKQVAVEMGKLRTAWQDIPLVPRNGYPSSGYWRRPASGSGRHEYRQSPCGFFCRRSGCRRYEGLWTTAAESSALSGRSQHRCRPAYRFQNPQALRVGTSGGADHRLRHRRLRGRRRRPSPGTDRRQST